MVGVKEVVESRRLVYVDLVCVNVVYVDLVCRSNLSRSRPYLWRVQLEKTRSDARSTDSI